MNSNVGEKTEPHQHSRDQRDDSEVLRREKASEHDAAQDAHGQRDPIKGNDVNRPFNGLLFQFPMVNSLLFHGPYILNLGTGSHRAAAAPGTAPSLRIAVLFAAPRVTWAMSTGADCDGFICEINAF
jgi:hypothetical protein